MCKSMNKAEFKAIMMIAEKLGWTEVNFETISQMVRNQQSLELDTVGECDDEEMTLLSLATCSADKILSTQKVFDYETMVEWNVDTFLEDMGKDYLDLQVMKEYADKSAKLLAAEYEMEDSFAIIASEYNDADWNDFYNARNSWIRNNCW